MRKFIGSPKFDNLTDEQFEVFIQWITSSLDVFKYASGYPRNLRGKFGLESEKRKTKQSVALDAHEMVEYWYYEIYKGIDPDDVDDKGEEGGPENLENY